MSKPNQSFESSDDAWEEDEDSGDPGLTKDLIQLRSKVQNVYGDAKHLPWLSAIAIVVPIVLIALPFVVPLHIFQRRSLLKELHLHEDHDLDLLFQEPLPSHSLMTVGEAVHVLETKWTGVYIACAYLLMIVLAISVAVIVVAFNP